MRQAIGLDISVPENAKSCRHAHDCGDSCFCVTLNPETAGGKICMDSIEALKDIQDCILNGQELFTTEPSAHDMKEANRCVQNVIDAAINKCRDGLCISTQWLEQRGLEHHTIAQHGTVKVLRIPGLPCGTSGHILRQCLSNDKDRCVLITYQEACNTRLDCVESESPVSQLSHSFDWSQFTSDDRTLILTSLSVDPQARKWSLSRGIAHIGDRINSYGLGTLTNAICRVAQLKSPSISNIRSYSQS